jgi:hypothetical protein
MKEQFLTPTLSPKELKMLDIIEKILFRYKGMGYKLTPRQLYYRLVSQGNIPNKQREYEKLCRLLNDSRRMGLLDWDAIEDRHQVPRNPYYIIDAQSTIPEPDIQLRINRQIGQPVHIEVWTEKEALFSQLYQVTQFYNVNLVVNKDLTSYSAMYDAYERIQKTEKPCTILYLGDIDPSRLYIVTDILFKFDQFGLDVNFQKIALTIEDVLELDLPQNPVKMKKSRAKIINEIFWDLSWELEALDPFDLITLLDKSLYSLMDKNIFDNIIAEELKQDPTLYNM